MQIPILIEPIDGGRFRARSAEPFAATAEGSTAEEATQQIEQLLLDRVRNGVRIGVVNLPNGVPDSAPPFPADDLYKESWVFRELQAAIAENRRLEDEGE